MENRASLLCLMNQIGTFEQYAKLIDVSLDVAKRILTKREILTEDIIARNCRAFKCSKAFFLCLE